jgi:hypothetical protein
MDNCAIDFPRILLKFFPVFEPGLDGGSLLPRRSHFRCKQFPYKGFTRPDWGNGRPDGWFDVRNFYIWSKCIRTMLTGIRTVELYMHDLPYGGHRPDGITHLPDGCCRLPITVSWSRNPKLVKHWMASGRYSNVVRTDSLEHWDLLELLKSVRTICHYVWTDANFNCSKLLDTDARPDGKFSSSRRMLLTEELPDKIPRRPDGCKGTELLKLHNWSVDSE